LVWHGRFPVYCLVVALGTAKNCVSFGWIAAALPAGCPIEYNFYGKSFLI
jgi:hypothetical protein